MPVIIGAIRWPKWGVRRVIELVTFVGTLLVVNRFKHGSVIDETEIKGVIAVVLTYSMLMLYVPISAVANFTASRFLSRDGSGVFDSVIFLSHGYVAMSVLNNGPLGISRHVDLDNLYVVSWLAVVLLHVVLIAKGIFLGGPMARVKSDGLRGHNP